MDQPCEINRLQKLEETVSEMRDEIKNLQTICSRMDSHIDFVETTYEKFSHPLHIVKQKIEGFFGHKKLE